VTTFGEQVDHRFPDQRPVAEFRGIEIAADRQTEVDHAVGVLQQRDGKVQRQVHRLRALYFFAEGQALHHQLVVACQLAFVDLVFQVHRKFPGVDLAAGKLARVGGEPGHFHVAEDNVDVGEGLGIRGV
jgi:hypothetical protein